MIFNAVDKHLYTIIILHGMFQTNKSLFSTANAIQDYNKNIKIILPNAPKRTISWDNIRENNVSSWYDYYTRRDGEMKHDEINLYHFKEQTNRIYNIIDQERKIISNKKIIIAGISQGGTLAFNVALNCKYLLGGMIGIHTILMDNIISQQNTQKIPIYLFSGENDSIYNIKLQQNSIYPSTKITNWFIEKNLEHCQKSNNEIEFILNSISDIYGK